AVNPGHYELFAYRFKAYDATSGSDKLVGGSGNATFRAGVGNNTIIGGTGTNTVIAQGDVNYSLTSGKLTFGAGTDSLSNIQNAVLIGGFGSNTYTIDPTWKGGLTLITVGGSDA